MARKSRTRRPRVLKRADHQTGKSDSKRDRLYKALPPGKRISRTGKVYYEYRRNRSDLTRDEMPRRKNTGRRTTRKKGGKRRKK